MVEEARGSSPTTDRGMTERPAAQAPGTVWMVAGRTTPVARRARLAAGLGAERRRKRAPSCSISVSVSESRSARIAGHDPVWPRPAGEERAEDVTADGLVELVVDRAGGEEVLGGAESGLDAPELL